MTLTFADRLAAKPVRGDLLANHVADLLKKPRRNHSGERFGQIERFVLDEANLARLSETFPTPASRQAALDSARAPCIPCFISIGEAAGAYIQRGGLLGEAVFFAEVRGLGIRYLGAVALDDFRTANFSMKLAPFYAGANEDLGREFLTHLCSVLPCLLAALGSTRFATVEKITPRAGGTPASQVSARRLGQRGRPMFSYNVVRLVVPQASIQRGECAAAASAVPKREHTVIGHWRLIGRGDAPYWTWVDGHSRGEPSLGAIVKERHLTFKREVRRGFVMPARVGLPGQHIPAEAAR